MDKVLILGGTGMLGHALLRHLSAEGHWSVQAAVRDITDLPAGFPGLLQAQVIPGLRAEDFDSVMRVVAGVKPDVIINAIGLIKQGGRADDPLRAVTINSQFPHRLADLCLCCGSRMIQISTDCVFDGNKGDYTEQDQTSPVDLYGRSKLLGEVLYPGCLTLRTSIIGHELKGFLGLLEWFLAQKGLVQGYTKAFFSGITTVELARVLTQYVLPDGKLEGLYHLSAARISKYDLLQLVARHYGKEIAIAPCPKPQLDRSLDSSAFRTRTGYTPPTWEELVARMHADFLSTSYYWR